MPHFLTQAAVTVPTTPNIGEAVVAFLIAANAALNYFRGKRADERHSSKLDDVVQRLEQRIDNHQRTNELALQELRQLCIGIDGGNGIRGEAKRANERLDELDRRERDRLERTVYDRRSPHEGR